MSRNPPTRRPSCRYCCNRCGCHFASLVAFDRHLGWMERENGDRRRVCESPAALDGLGIQSEDAVCRIAPNDLEGVTLWEAVHKPSASKREAIWDAA